MSICTHLSMAASALPDRRVFAGVTLADLESDSARGAAWLRTRPAATVAFLGENTPLLTGLLFAAAGAGLPFAPLNYRLPTALLRDQLDRLDAPVVIAGPGQLAAAGATGHPVVSAQEWTSAVAGAEPLDGPEADPDPAAVLLFTSGTSAEPKCVVLRHSHLLSYVLGTVEFVAADENDCALVCVPPYHVAGIGSALSNVYSGRRVVHLPAFTPAAWLDLVRSAEVTSAMVVPTMLARIVEHLDGRPARCPTLRSLAYGGARMPLPVLEAALHAFPDTAFANAYGLTETSSTIAVLGPDELRAAFASDDPVVDAGGWFPTRDRARLDDAGYLHLAGRADDVIIRGGENIALPHTPTGKVVRRRLVEELGELPERVAG